MSRQLTRLVWACLFTWIASAALVTAQPDAKDEKKEPTKEPGKVEAAKEPTKQASEPPATIMLRLNTGTTIQDALLLATVEMDTKLGKLSIPASEVRRIDFAFRLSADDAKAIEQALKDLASDKHANREVATKTLTKM